ncbi:unnamed protein product, partial [Ranitomeya imitator]
MMMSRSHDCDVTAGPCRTPALGRDRKLPLAMERSRVRGEERERRRRALKVAHAGISLSEQEASVASPFTSQTTNIQCVPELIKEGRAALVSSFAVFKYVTLYAMIQFVCLLLLYWQLKSVGLYQYLIQDVGVTVLVCLTSAALNLMDLEFARRCGFVLEPLQCPIPLRGIDATPLAKNKPQYWTQLTMCMAPAHQEDIRFLVLHNLHDVVVLGLPWLQVHNPVLDWKSMSVSSWGCQGVHGDVLFLSISSSTPSEVPEFLCDYRDVFDEPKSNALPPHRDCDCAIDLIPGSKFPKGRLFNLSVPEHAAMRSYVKESLEKGHIRPLSSPLGAGFFFVAKKDGSLRPCIDYRLLNKITVKFQYPLPLLSDLFARIKGASWFTKIDLRGAYNLVRIKRGDEWKTAFNMPEGHFEYLVMPFGLSNAPSVFQSFMHDIFREYLDKFLIVYLDDILVFSDDWESHVKQ